MFSNLFMQQRHGEAIVTEVVAVAAAIACKLTSLKICHFVSVLGLRPLYMATTLRKLHLEQITGRIDMGVLNSTFGVLTGLEDLSMTFDSYDDHIWQPGFPMAVFGCTALQVRTHCCRALLLGAPDIMHLLAEQSHVPVPRMFDLALDFCATADDWM